MIPRNASIKISPDNPSSESLQNIVNCLLQGGVVMVPTDTVYGLICDIDNPQAVSRIYQLKKRDSQKPLPVLVNGFHQVLALSDSIPDGTETLCKTYWPGALTIIVPCSQAPYAAITCGTGKIGLRMPQSQLVTRLIEQLGRPVASTSANYSDEPPCIDFKSLPQDFLTEIDLIVDGGIIGSGIPSTVVDLTTEPPRILREGNIQSDDIRRILQIASL